MIRRLFILLFAVAALAGFTASAHGRDLRVSFSGRYSTDYYDDLEPYGTWVSVSYGWAWCPLDVSASWRPYTVGRWAYTDWGWMWVSADPWGSTPYHYGRWVYDDFYGWLWIPGDVWAPAWVSWRYGGDYIGWAPLPPDFGWQVSVGFRYSSYDYDRRIPSYAWCFSSGSGFLDSRVQIAPPSRNVTLINVTRNVTRYEVVGSLPAERGLRPEFVSRVTGRTVPRYRLVDSPGLRGRDPQMRGNEIAVSRPRPAGRATDRVRAVPPERYRRSPERAMQRQRSEQGRVSDRMRQERRELEQTQQRELRERPRGVSDQTLRRRHEAELRAQRAREEQTQRTYQRRQERLDRPNRGARQRDEGAVQERQTRPARQERGNVQERPARRDRQDRTDTQERPSRVREDRSNGQDQQVQPARENRDEPQQRPERRQGRSTVKQRPAPQGQDKAQEPQQPDQNRKKGRGRRDST